MPGHKGKPLLGCEPFDITEIQGADVLYSAEGIIAESEKNASRLFGSAHTFYSAEGSSLSIKAMLALAAYDSKNSNNAVNLRKKPLVIAARNVHKAFVYACALLDLDVDFIFPNTDTHLCRCEVSAVDVDNAIRGAAVKPCAVYVTSPDYLGNILDIKAISEVCHRHGVPLLVDNAQGAYLAFLRDNLHPIALGADMCCDSAHKTLPALTGAAYLHISQNAPEEFVRNARGRLSLFASTSPSYLILQSLDLCNKYLSDGYPKRLENRISEINKIKEKLRQNGHILEGDEPLKITVRTVNPRKNAISPDEILRRHGIECEYCDGEYTVCMITPENTKEELSKLENALLKLPHGSATIPATSEPLLLPHERISSIREAIFAPHETVPTELSVGRICASPTVSCPPAVPIVVSGEKITEQALTLFKRYGISEVDVIKQ